MTLILCLSLVPLLFQLATISSAPTSKSLAGCPKKCGNITIPYPFGFTKDCYRDESLHLQCDSTNYDPPKLFLPSLGFRNNTEITMLSYDDVVTISTLKAINCSVNLNLTTKYDAVQIIDIRSLPAFVISAARNKYVVIGCRTLGGYSITYNIQLQSCSAACTSQDDIKNKSCNGSGCCQMTIPKSTKYFIYAALSYKEGNYNSWKINPCGYSFLVDQDRYEFMSTDIHALGNRTRFPVALDWVVGVQT